MKKFIFILLILAAAVYWGFSEGDDLTKNVSHPPVKTHTVQNKNTPATPAKEDTSILSDVTQTVSTLISGLSSSETTEGSVEVKPPKDTTTQSPLAQKEQLLTMKEKADNLFHFKEALESRVHRENFVPIDQIPDLLKKGLIATEDRRFYEHGAIDLIGVGRAAFTNYMAGQTIEGGSTIAQQTVKNIFLSNERTMTRKAEELALAVQLERNYSKDQILELYLNTIYFGHGAYGLKEASHTYFGKEPKDLDLSQCAMLAGLPQAPSAYDPIDHPKEGAKRMTTVLALMAEQGVITPAEAAKAAAELWLK